MRESIGSALLLNIMLVIVGVISLFLISSIAYSKAFKVKNRIISIIEKYDGDCFGLATGSNPTDACYAEIEEQLNDMGYSSNISQKCPTIKPANPSGTGAKWVNVKRVYPNNNYDSGHRYCVYKYTLCSETYGSACKGDSTKTNYYKVITFMHFDIPIIGQFLEFQVSGETKAFYDTFINIKS